MKKDDLEIESHKQQLINDLKRLKKNDLIPKPMKKVSLFKKLLIIFGHGE